MVTNAHPIAGIDFSGSVNAGRKIWLAVGSADGERVEINWLCRAADLPAGAPDRDQAILALRNWIAAHASPIVIGCDFPFSLARAVHRYPTWDAFAAAFPNDYAQPEHLFAAGRAAGSPTRQTDREARTPFAPHNLRIYRQTYYGIRDLLAPLAAAGQASILPFHDPNPNRPNLIEVCPASLLKAHGHYHPYKGAARRSARVHLFEWLTSLDVAIPADLQAIAVSDSEGDALDSILSAVCAARALNQIGAPQDEIARIEGRVYF